MSFDPPLNFEIWSTGYPPWSVNFQKVGLIMFKTFDDRKQLYFIIL